jgi:hypothetical protein
MILCTINLFLKKAFEKGPHTFSGLLQAWNWSGNTKENKPTLELGTYGLSLKR